MDNDGDPRLEFDISVKHGATTEAISNDLRIWVDLLPEFTKHIGW